MADRGCWRPPRDCNDYWYEWKHCKSLQNLFHNYYTFGQAPDCQDWKKDYTTCREWEKNKNEVTKEALRHSERERLKEKQNHSPVWTLRKTPPPDWYLPLDTDKPRQ